MGSDKLAKNLSSVKGQRRRLSDITNTTPSINRMNSCEDIVPCELQTSSSIELQKKIISLKKTLAEKEALIETQKGDMEKLMLKYLSKSRQNEEIIQHNEQLYKDLMQARDRLKILQHENIQMTSVHKISMSELQLRLNETLEQLSNHQKNMAHGGYEDKQSPPKLAESKYYRTANANTVENVSESTLNDSARAGEGSAGASTISRNASRRKSSISYKEPSLKVKLRQEQSSSAPAFTSKSRNEQSKNAEGFHTVCEEDQESSITASSISSASAEILEETRPPSSANGDTIETTGRDSGTSSAVIMKETKGTFQLQCTPISSTAETEHFSRRVGNGRPVRKAVESICSYKENPLKTKMRRPE